MTLQFLYGAFSEGFAAVFFSGVEYGQNPMFIKVFIQRSIFFRFICLNNKKMAFIFSARRT
jgi:hypothetical protein